MCVHYLFHIGHLLVCMQVGGHYSFLSESMLQPLKVGTKGSYMLMLTAIARRS